MRWSTACRNAPDETPRMRAMQSAADPDRSALEQTGRNPQYFFVVLSARVAHPSPSPIGWTACRGSAFLQRTALALVCASPIGRKMTHTLIWRAARTKRFMTIFGVKSTPPGIWNSAHAHPRMPASARRMPRAECCCKSEDGRCCRCCW